MFKRAAPLTPAQRLVADRLYAEYMQRPKNAARANQSVIRAAVRAGANRVARHGNPPSYNQRLGYRTAKRNRARRAAIALYGDPCAPSPSPSSSS